MEKSKSLRVVILVYFIALICAGFLAYSLDATDPMAKLFFIDVTMTIVVFLFSLKFNNASLYDPYWSLIPFLMLFYWLYIFGLEAISIKVFITAFIVSYWSWRLTGNWLRGWKGMQHEDWRYIDLRKKTGKWYILVNFLGIQIFPTLVVFAAAMPLAYIFMYSQEMNMFTWIGAIIALSGIILEQTADNQLHKFKIKENNPIAIMRFGVWKYLRHPNYLGEILFWVGLSLISFTPGTTVYFASGALLVTAMFVFISIPMIDKRLLKSKPGYDIYLKSTWALIPKFPK